MKDGKCETQRDVKQSNVCFQAWNPASEQQCIDRCHRLGQTRKVVVTKVSRILIWCVCTRCCSDSSVHFVSVASFDIVMAGKDPTCVHILRLKAL